ncbi:MAG TPA: UvrD-helicase domain-containing protein [Thermoanaerobaculia bacterium]|nr:UvrD-helicase domain-containing protein [Thermoanaerobaculia bacterium]
MSQQQSLFDVRVAPAPKPPARRNLVIEAGAGTGKTTAIVGEVLKLMLSDENLSPERIVLMTFTEKAAGEIADRIHAALAEVEAQLTGVTRIVWPTGSEHPVVEMNATEAIRRACAAQLARIHLLRSQTIHSFCQSLLRQFPIEAGLDPQFKIVEGFERTLLHSQLYDAWIDEETRTKPSPAALREWEVLLAHAGYHFQIRDMIFTLVDRRDLLDEAGYDLGDLSLVADNLRAALFALRRGDHPLHRYIASSNTPARDAELDEWIDYFSPIAQLIRDINLNRFPKNERDHLRTLRAGGTARSIYDRLVSHRAAAALHELARRFVAFLDREKRALGVVDFDDLLIRTLALLDDQKVLERARRQYDFIFVDEFQDTDRTQAKIIDRLARDASGRYVDGKTIVVGDPKQSIYGFRRADPETYFRMTERLLHEGAERRRIEDNYRSDAPLLHAVNGMFVKLFPDETEHDPNVFRPEYRALRPGKSANDRELDARITLLHAAHEEISDRYIAEAESIAAWIAKTDPQNLKRFALLFRRMTRIDDYLDVFDKHGIEYLLPPTRMFLDRRAPVDLLAVLRAIAYAFDRGAQISAARTPYFALTDEEIALGLTSPQSSVLGPQIEDRGPRTEDRGLVAWRSFEEAIARFRDQARALTVSQLIDRVVSTTGIEAVYEAAAGGERSQRHLDHLRAIAFEYDRKIGGSVRQFVDEITRRRAEPDEMEPLLADESKNAVRILTVHAAKGLEFDSVILPDLAFSTGSEGTQIFTVEEPKSLVLCAPDSLSAQFRFIGSSIGDEKLKRVATLREEAEARRLFYVAVTRARSEVVLVCNTMKRVANSSFAHCAGEALGIDFKTLTFAEGREIRDGIAYDRLSGAPAASPARRRLKDESLEHELSEGPIVPLAVALPEPSAPIPEAYRLRAGLRNRDAGILLHRVLELWDGVAPIASLIAEAANELGASTEAATRVKSRLGNIAQSPTMQRIARAETVARELPIRIDGTTLRIDRLIRENGQEIVIDYKSGIPKPDDQAQVERYCQALARLTGRACEGLIWYLDDDTAVEVECR